MNASLPKQTGMPLAHVRPSVVRFDKVGKVFPGRRGSAEVTALADIDLDVPEGAIVGVIGRSGAGKSTLIRMVNGLERPTSGHVRVNGVDIGALDEKALRHQRRAIGMIFQHFNLLASRTAFDNIALPLEIAGVAKSEIPDIVEPLLALVGLADKRDRYPAELSGGQKQRIGIARALATKPKVLLSDEATSALDPETTDQILDLLKTINAELNLTILFITHEMSVVKKLADRVAVMDHGRIIEQGSTFDIFAHPRHPTTQRFVGSITGGHVPDWLTAKLKSERDDGGSAVLRMTFAGGDEDRAVLTRVSRTHDVDLNILHGRIEAIAGRPFGTLIVSIAAAPAKTDAVIADLQTSITHVEHLGHVG